MNGIVPVTDMYHFGVVTQDYRRAMENYSRIFGIPRWEIRNLTEDLFKNPLVRGKHVRQNFVSALGVGGPISFELVEPLAGDKTLYAEFRDEVGTGLHHISPTLMSQEEFEKLVPKLGARNIGFAQSAEISDTVDYWYIDAEAQIGTFIELLVIKGPNPEGTPPHQIVEFGAEITHTANKLPIDKLCSYSVIARQPVSQYQQGYEDLFGINEWLEYEGVPDGTLKNQNYHGVPQDLRFRLAAGRQGALGVEIVEPLSGPSVFEERLVHGPGMQYLTTSVMDQSTWESTEKWLASQEIPIAQDSWSQDGSTYTAYLDARSKLDNIYLKVIVQS